MRHIKYIVIHCTGTVPNARVSGILNYWKHTLGWKSPGYHRLIEAGGLIHKLQPFALASNGVKGYNANSIHISYVGGCDHLNRPCDTRTIDQTVGLLSCIMEALKCVMEHQIETPQIVGHHDLYSGKACPSFNAKKEYAWITEQKADNIAFNL